MKQSIYEKVTNSIVAELEKGVKPWVRPWEKKMLGLPKNLITGKHYRGINILTLWVSAKKFGFTSEKWATFLQARKLGHNVKKGEHGASCFYFKLCEKKLDDKDDESTVIKYPMPKEFTVFNANQIEGMDIQEKPVIHHPIESAKKLVEASCAEIIHGRHAALFCPSNDKIYMPLPQKFRSIGDYYATLLHELTHWTGRTNRLNRTYDWLTGSKSSYAVEELVAEIGSAFLCAELGIIGELQHSSYIDSWLSLLHKDKRMIFKAANLAQTAFEYLIALIQPS